MSSRKNVILGLNPALQRSITLTNTLVPGSVNRGQDVNIGIGGKGQNVFCGALSMQVTDIPYIAQFLGEGAEGDLLLSLLQSKITNESSNHHNPFDLSCRTHARLRNAITLIDSMSGIATEIVEPSGVISPHEIESLTNIFRTEFHSSKVDGVAVMGSMPPGCPTDYYSTLLNICVDKQSWIVLDIVSQVIPIVTAVRSRVTCPILLKVNARELYTIAGLSVDKLVRESAEAADIALIDQACQVLFGQLYSAGIVMEDVYVAVTDGPHSGHLIQAAATSSATSSIKFHFKFDLPALPGAVVNPIGAGDAVSSGTLMALTNRVNRPLDQSNNDKYFAAKAFQWGLACGAASCLSPINSFVDLSIACTIYNGIRMTEERIRVL